MTVKIYYLDGTHHTINGGYVDGRVNWGYSGTTILDSNRDIICKVPTPMLEILYIEERDPECGTVIIRHPTVRPMSVNVDVMTANSRRKATKDGVKEYTKKEYLDYGEDKFFKGIKAGEASIKSYMGDVYVE